MGRMQRPAGTTRAPGHRSVPRGSGSDRDGRHVAPAPVQRQSSLPFPRLSPALGSSTGTAAASAASHLSPVAPRRGTNAVFTCGERRGTVRASSERPAGSFGRPGPPAGPHLAAAGATLQHLPVLAPAGNWRGATLFPWRAGAEVGGEERGRELHGRGTGHRGHAAGPELPVSRGDGAATTNGVTLALPPRTNWCPGRARDRAPPPAQPRGALPPPRGRRVKTYGRQEGPGRDRDGNGMGRGTGEAKRWDWDENGRGEAVGLG